MTRQAAVFMLGFIARGELRPEEVANVHGLLVQGEKYLRAAAGTWGDRARVLEVRRGLQIVRTS